MSPTFTLAIILGLFLVLLIDQTVRIEITALATIAALALTRLLDPAAAFSGFSSPATITIAAMLVLSAGIERSGAMDSLASTYAWFGSKGERRLLFAMLIPIALMSAFLNNTPVVALMIPVTLALARKTGVPPSRMLIPVSYVSILGGTCTLVGTSTNILVDSLHRQHGGEGFEMFEFSGLGVLYLLVGGSYVLLVGPYLLPRRGALSEVLTEPGQGDFVTIVTVPEGSALDGKDLASGIRGADEVKVLEVVRNGLPRLRPRPEFELRAGDVVMLEGSARAIHGLIERTGVEPGTALEDDRRVPLGTPFAATVQASDVARRGGSEVEEGEERDESGAEKEPSQLGRTELRIVEAIVTPTSSFRHQRVQDLGLNRRFRVQLLALRRHGRQHQFHLRSLRLHAGDTLLVQGEPDSLRALQGEEDLLFVEGEQRTLSKPKKGPIAIAILAAVIALAATGAAPVSVLGVAGATLMILTGCLDTRETMRALDASVLLLIAASIPLGVAMEEVGLASDIAAFLSGIGEGAGIFVLVGAVYFVTSLLTAVLSNNAAAVLLVPIALGVSAQLGVDAKPLLAAIAFGASASFATPIGYQTNMLVMGPGGYTFRDYLRIGVPLNVILWLTATALIPLFWPG